MKSLRTILAGMVSMGALVVVGGAALSGSAGATASVGNCTPGHLVVRAGQSQGTAGTLYVPIVFTNTGARCSIFGVPAIQPVRGPGHQPVGPLARNLSMGEMPALHQLGQGRSVSVAVGVTDTGALSPKACAARKVSGVLVTLGSFVTNRYVKLPITVCSKMASVTTKLITPGVRGY